MNAREMEDLLNRFEDKREIKNLMGKYMSALAVRKDDALWELFWAKEKPDVALGFNDGFYSGRAAIQGFYAARRDRIMRASKLMQQVFPEELGALDDEALYGVGMFEQKPIQNAWIVIAGDRQTAKGLWALNGCFADITEAGPTASWVWAYIAADFIMEDDAWKLWHMQYLEDIHVRCGQNWAGEAEKLPVRVEFAELRGSPMPEPNVKKTLWTLYSPERPFAGTPPIPEPYETFAETFSYGA